MALKVARDKNSTGLYIELYMSRNIPSCCIFHTSLVALFYRIMQIVHSGKVSQLHDLLVIHEKTFVIVQQFKTPYNKKEKIRWKTFAIGG